MWECEVPETLKPKRTNMSTEEVTAEQALNDLKVVANDAEELLKATAGHGGDKAQNTRERLTAALESAKATCRKLEEKAIAGAKATDKVIRAHPYESIGIAFGLGLLIGVLVSRK